MYRLRSICPALLGLCGLALPLCGASRSGAGLQPAHGIGIATPAENQSETTALQTDSLRSDSAALSLSALQSPFALPLNEMLDRIGRRFGVRLVCKRFRADTVSVRWAPFRIRPCSLEQTLDHLLTPLDLVWKRKADRVEIQPYEYYRRTVAEGEELLGWLSSFCRDRERWERRRAHLLAEARAALDVEPFVRALADHPVEEVGRIRRHAGYTTCNFALETLAGLYVCGTVYAPAGSGRRKRPLVVVPSGHWPEGRYRADHQRLMATLARMGAVAVDMDIFGWGASEEQIGIEAHTTPYAMQMQVLWSLRVTDWILRTRKDVDPERMAATGGSGGATHALLLALVDGRFAALAPVVHIVSHFDGGCPCESGRPVTLAAGGSCMPEILAAVMAPRPVLTVSDGGDWTASYPTLEYPYLRQIWNLYGASDRIRNRHFADERHDFGPSKRQAVYEFLAEVLGLSSPPACEEEIELLPAAELQIFSGERPWPANALRSRESLESMIEKLK